MKLPLWSVRFFSHGIHVLMELFTQAAAALAKWSRRQSFRRAEPQARHARFALMENEHRPCALTNDEVTLPVAALGSGVDILGPFVDGDAIPDGILRRSRSARAAAFVMAREVTP
jgi:hypothetical protein